MLMLIMFVFQVKIQYIICKIPDSYKVNNLKVIDTIDVTIIVDVIPWINAVYMNPAMTRLLSV